ncbi:SLAIN motif-containing protein-like [Aulostomus maculatus]
MYNSSNSQKEMQDRESQDVQSALDLVELLEVEDDVEDEESWLYESPKKQVSVDTESALTWCRQVLDNPSPEMEAACRRLINKLDQSHSHSSRLYRCPAVFHQTDEATADSSVYKTSANTIHSTTNSFDKDELNVSHDSITSSYRLQDITDVHIMARIQEDSLRQDYVSPRRSPDSQLPFASSRPLAKQSCQSPKLARLHQQVTQFKLLKLAQNQGTPAGRTRSPLQTSLRSLQAIRNSRSLETDDCHAADQITHPATGVSPARLGSSWGSPSLPAASLSSKGSSVQMPTKNLQRSHSLSPCRIPHSAKGFLSVHKRVFAAPERQTTVAWGRFVPSHRR